MNQDAIDRLCERILSLSQTPPGRNSPGGIALAAQVRAALEGERARAEALRRLQLIPPRRMVGGSGVMVEQCALCCLRWAAGEAEIHSAGCLASPEPRDPVALEER